jgi:retinol dehydrogenase-12
MANRCYIIQWGRVGHLKENLSADLGGESQGHAGVAKRFYESCEDETRLYME